MPIDLKIFTTRKYGVLTFLVGLCRHSLSI